MRRSIYILKLFLVSTAISNSLSAGVRAQSEQTPRPTIVGEDRGIDGRDCDMTKADFDLIAEAAGEGVIAIGRLGEGEVSRNLVRRRLQNLGDYLHYTRSIPQDRIIRAEGERVEGLGRVEVYIGGKLFMVFHIKRNKDFLTGCKT